MIRGVMRESGLLDPLPRLERHERILQPEAHDAVVVTGPRDLTAHQAVAEPSQLVAIQVVDVVVYELRRRGGLGMHAVTPQLVDHLGAIAVRHQRCGPGRHKSPATYARASAISGGSAALDPHASMRAPYSPHAEG